PAVSVVVPGRVSVPAVGRTSRAAIRSSVVLPEPFRPAKTRHSLLAISSETPRKAYRVPYRLSILSKRMAGPDAGLFTAHPRPAISRQTPWRLASQQIAQDLLRATAFLRVFLLGNGAGLSPQLQPEKPLLESVQAGAHLLIYLLQVGSRHARKGRRV